MDNPETYSAQDKERRRTKKYCRWLEKEKIST